MPALDPSVTIDRHIEPIVKESVKVGTIAPIIRPRVDSFEVGKRDSTVVYDVPFPNNISKPLDEIVAINKGDILSSPEFRKSKSLTRKIKELSVRERYDSPVKDGMEPPTSIHITSGLVPHSKSVSGHSNISKSASVNSTIDVATYTKDKERDLQPLSQSTARESPSKFNTARLNQTTSPSFSQKGKSSTSLQTMKAHTAVPNLFLEKLNSSTGSDKSDQDDSITSFYQHYALPKSLLSNGTGKSSDSLNVGRSNNISNSAMTVANVAIQKTKPRTSSIANQAEYVVVENNVILPGLCDKAAENDRILLERLQQAKAMGRKDDNGATMHTFALWKPKTQHVSAAVDVVAADAIDNSLIQAGAGKYSSRLRGVTATVEVSMDSCDEQNESGRDGEYSFSNDNNISMIKLDSNVGSRVQNCNSQDYSEDDFIKDDESEVLIDRSGVLGGDTSTLSLNGSRNLSNVLRSRIDDAKQFDESYSSSVQGGQNHRLLDEFDCSYTSFGGKEDIDKQPSCDPFEVMETSIHHVTEDDVSVGSVEEEVLARELNNASQINSHHISTDFGSLPSIQTMMSRSGPAAFLSPPSSLPSVDEQLSGLKQFPFDDDCIIMQDGRRASSGALEFDRSTGMQYEPIRMRSLTSRDVKESQHSRLNSSTNNFVSDSSKPSKYQVMKHLKQNSLQHGNQKRSVINPLEKVGELSPSSTINPFATGAGIPPSGISINPTGGAVLSISRGDNSSPLSEISDTDDQPSLLVKHTLGDGIDPDCGDDQCPSPLKWKKGEVIGEGTFGKVFKGLNEKTGELLAIKQIALADGSNKEVEELRREISVMWDLDHPHIVRYVFTNWYVWIMISV